MARSTFVYVTYIRTTPQKLWSALTDDTEFMKQYWFGTHCESRWTAGSPWKMISGEGTLLDSGEIVEAEQRAFDAQGGDQNQEIFPVIQKLKALLGRRGVAPAP